MHVIDKVKHTSSRVFAVGFSLGSGSVTKYVSEQGENCLLSGAVSVANGYNVKTGMAWVHNQTWMLERCAPSASRYTAHCILGRAGLYIWICYPCQSKLAYLDHLAWYVSNTVARIPPLHRFWSYAGGMRGAAKPPVLRVVVWETVYVAACSPQSVQPILQQFQLRCRGLPCAF